jgi:DNA replication and repair protein RecF
LDAWDLLFVEKASRYLEYRFAFIEFLESKIPFIQSVVGAKYSLRLVYETKADRYDLHASIKEYNAGHREKDILVGHTCIGPHLDDLYFEVQTRHGWVRTESFLSRGENKSILLALKLLSIEFLETASETKSLLLLDDITSELDEAHVQTLFGHFGDRPYILTGHTIPESLRQRGGTVNMYLDENGRFV